MSLPAPSPKYDAGNEAQTRSLIEQDMAQMQRRTGVSEPQALILKSPNGTRWQASIDNAGVLTWTAL